MNRWIEVKEQMPNFYVDVFLYNDIDGTIEIGYADEEEGKFAGFKGNTSDKFNLRGVTLWMPIIFPDSPKF